MTTNNKTILNKQQGGRLKLLRIMNGLTSHEVVMRTNIQLNSIYLYEKGRNGMRAMTAFALARTYNVYLETLLVGCGTISKFSFEWVITRQERRDDLPEKLTTITEHLPSLLKDLMAEKATDRGVDIKTGCHEVLVQCKNGTIRMLLSDQLYSTCMDAIIATGITVYPLHTAAAA